MLSPCTLIPALPVKENVDFLNTGKNFVTAPDNLPLVWLILETPIASLNCACAIMPSLGSYILSTLLYFIPGVKWKKKPPVSCLARSEISKPCLLNSWEILL